MQRDFFSVFDDCARTKARTSDPSTSSEAAQDLVASGKLNDQCRAVLAALKESPMSTSAELGSRLPCGDKSRYVAARRLPDLEKLGMVRRGPARKCFVNGTNAVVWWVV